METKATIIFEISDEKTIVMALGLNGSTMLDITKSKAEEQFIVLIKMLQTLAATEEHRVVL